MKSLFVTFCILFVSTSSWITCDRVPMVLWNMKGTVLPMRPVSAFEVSNDKYTEELLQSTLKDESTSMIVYVGDKLSMEDLALASNTETPGNPLKTLEVLLDDQSHIMFPSVKDPMRHFRDVTCGVKDVHAGKHNTENLEKSISAALENSCVVIVHLGNKGLPADKKLSIKTLSKKNLVGVFTASKSSWHPLEESHRRSRSLLAADTEASHFMNYSGCIIMYAEKITLKIGSDSNNETKALVFPPTVDGNCGNETNRLELTFPKSADNPEVILTFNFKRMVGDWIMDDSSVQIKGSTKAPEEELPLRSSLVDVPLSFSYSCNEFTLKSNFSTTPVVIMIDGFQVQPYDVHSAFARSFDCVPFFTLSIWMGIFIGILFIFILNSGIYALFNIKTMDRFDDPKGKTISVPLGAE